VRRARRGAKRRPNSGAGRTAAKEPRAPIDQKYLDLIGLGLILLGIYMVFVLYFGWEGGRLGSGLSDALTYTFGVVAYLTPVVLFAGGGILMFRPALPATRPLRTGALLLIAGMLLAFAAGTFGLAGGRGSTTAYFDTGWFPEHGGVVGETLYWTSATLFQRFGAHLLAVFALLAGTLLLTGTTVAAVVSRGGRALKKAGSTSAGATRVLTRSGGPTVGADASGAGSETVVLGDDELTSMLPDEPADDELDSASPVEVDIWAEEGDEPTVTGNTEPLEPIEIFPGSGENEEVAAPDPAWAEVWTKALFLAGRRAIADEARAMDLAAWWVAEDGRLGMTPAARERSVWVAEARLG